ncbi:MAG: hypothetical protein M0042_09735 [Nitrospiraceae bacterium]|nr:hypothetical protein [Nitrospiraceae bacterium]
MKNTKLLSIMLGMALVAGVGMANTAYADETAISAWDGFAKQIDPSYTGHMKKMPLCQRAADGSVSLSDWDRFMASLDPSSVALAKSTLVCTGTASKAVASAADADWDAFMKQLAPAR